jgi:hypothetical protein
VVIDGEELVGVFTTTDALRVLADLAARNLPLPPS